MKNKDKKLKPDAYKLRGKKKSNKNICWNEKKINI